jgi:hypothetical protein
MTHLEREWSHLPQLVKAATKGSQGISENCVALQNVAVEFGVYGKRYEVRFGRKPKTAVGPEDSPPRIRWIFEPQQDGNQWFVASLGEALTTENLALKLSAKLTTYCVEYENAIAL